METALVVHLEPLKLFFMKGINLLKNQLNNEGIRIDNLVSYTNVMISSSHIGTLSGIVKT